MSGRPPVPQVRVEYMTPPSSPYGKRHDSIASSSHTVAYDPSPETRNESDATVFPYFPAEIKKPEAKPPKKAQGKGNVSNSAVDVNKPLPANPAKATRQVGGQKSNWLHAAKDTYKAGPQGEGQKVWKAYQKYRKEKLSVAEQPKQIVPPNHGSPSHQQSFTPDQTTHSALRTPHPQIPRTGRYFQSTQVPTTRKQSELSRTSYEVPLSFDSSIRPRPLYTNKTLPPVPQLDPAPNSRRQKAPPLPSVFHNANLPHNSSSKYNPIPPAPPAKDPWWRAHPDQKASKAHAALKAKISRPNPLIAPNNGVTVNVAVSAGGVGGPAAASSSSSSSSTKTADRVHAQDFAYMEAPPLHLSNVRPRTNESSDSVSKVKGKAKEAVRDDTPPTHWLDRFNPSAAAIQKTVLHRPQYRRKSSDASFACQGLPSPELHFGP
ncbi:hypothetical protein NX059_007551 [Plenodomus lindquistii]|nr:hypothetical protein NX059_007551 [Plenodomus lindquistii]